jgi:hypothetical protein
MASESCYTVLPRPSKRVVVITYTYVGYVNRRDKIDIDDTVELCSDSPDVLFYKVLDNVEKYMKSFGHSPGAYTIKSIEIVDK